MKNWIVGEQLLADDLNAALAATDFGDGSDGDATIASGTPTVTTDKFDKNLLGLVRLLS